MKPNVKIKRQNLKIPNFLKKSIVIIQHFFSIQRKAEKFITNCHRLYRRDTKKTTQKGTRLHKKKTETILKKESLFWDCIARFYSRKRDLEYANVFYNNRYKEKNKYSLKKNKTPFSYNLLSLLVNKETKPWFSIC